MLDIEKIGKEFTKILHSHTADDIQEWLDMHRKRIAEAELEKKNNHINGSAVNGTVVNGAVSRKVTQPRAVNGRFISKQTVASY